METKEQGLYSGMVTNTKELHALQQEVQHLQAQQNRQEELTLEMLLATESLQEDARRKAEALRQAEGKWGGEKAEGAVSRAELGAKQEEIQARGEQFFASLEVELVMRVQGLGSTRQALGSSS